MVPIEAGIEKSRPSWTSWTDSNSEFFFECEKCKSKKFWIPRKSNSTRCTTCQKPSTLAIVATTNDEMLFGSDAQQPDPDDSTTPNLCAWTVLHCKPTCPRCRGSHIDEIWNTGELKYRCSTCKLNIKSEADFLTADVVRDEKSMFSLTQKNRDQKK